MTGSTQKDLFADLLGNSSSRKPKNDVSSMSMAEQMSRSSSNIDLKNRNTSNNINLDYLTTHKSISASQNLRPQRKYSKGMEDLLSSFTEPNSEAATPSGSTVNVSMSKPKASNNVASDQMNLLEGFFNSEVPAKTTPAKSKEEVIPPESPKIDSQPSEQPQLHLRDTLADRKDSALAELVDMGFSAESAARALDQTHSGYDIQGAIDILTVRSERKQSIPLRTGRKSFGGLFDDQEESFGSFMNDISNNFKSKASKLLETGRQKIQEGIEMYKEKQYEGMNDEPAWMRNQAIYKKKSIPLPGDSGQEMSDESMRRVTELQRARDRRIRMEKVYGEEQLMPSQKYNHEQYAEPVQYTEPAQFTEPEQYTEPMQHSEPVMLNKTETKKDDTKATVAAKSADEALLDILSAPVDAGHQPTSQAPPAFLEARNEGTKAFKAGNFVDALTSYRKAYNTLSDADPLRIVMLSNLSTVYEKIGDPKGQLKCSEEGLRGITHISSDHSQMDTIRVEGDKTLRVFWVKLGCRKAEALEHLERFKDALKIYEELIHQGTSTKSVMDGRNRCRKIVQPMQPKPHRQVKRAVHREIPVKESETLRRVRKQEQEEEKIKDEQFRLHDKVEALLSNWSNGKKDNIRALLASLEQVLWPELHWKTVSMTDLVLDKKVKIAYLKAVSKVHPDKVGKNTTVEHKMIANGVFITLNEAWETYKSSL